MTDTAAQTDRLLDESATWLVTGAAGFIGSNLVDRLLALDQKVVGLDNFATGHRRNLEDVVEQAGGGRAGNFQFMEGDIRDFDACSRACSGVDYVLHQAALGSVPRSIERPADTNTTNVTGFLNMITAARDCEVRRFVYASSSSVYGDSENLPKVEDTIGRPLSPYAVTKLVNELYADNFHRLYGLEVVGLRYFNVFGPRQDPEGAYAAVIPRWIGRIRRGEPCEIFGDGETSRDFCYVGNAVEANIRAATARTEGVSGQAFNVACESRTTLTELYALIQERVCRLRPDLETPQVAYGPERSGDIRHSLADVSKARRMLGYEGTTSVAEGLDTTVQWFLARE